MSNKEYKKWNKKLTKLWNKLSIEEQQDMINTLTLQEEINLYSIFEFVEIKG